MTAAFLAMTMLALIVPIMLTVGWHYDTRRLNDRMAVMEAHVERVLATKNPDLEQLIGLIDRQMQRIQAPEQAVMDHSVSLTAPSPPAVGFDDDDAFFRSRSMTVEELAEAEMRAEVSGVVD